MEFIYSSDYSLIRRLVGSIATLCGLFIGKMMFASCIRHVKLIRVAKQFPGPPIIPLLGNTWEFVKYVEEPFDMMLKIAKIYSTGRVWIGSKLLIVITNPKDIEIVMRSNGTSKKFFGQDFMEPFIINSLINGYGLEMRASRNFLMPLINGGDLKNYMVTFNNEIRHTVDDLINKMDAKEFDIYDEMQYCIADIAFETILGIPGVGRNHGDLTVTNAMEVLSETLYQRIINPWLHPIFFFNLSKHGREWKTASTSIHKFIKKVIADKKKLHSALARSESEVKEKKISILDLWMENNVRTNAMNEQEMMYDLLAVYIGFNSSITSSFAFIMLMLAMHPEIQDKVREEVMLVIGNDIDITEDTIAELSYTQMVMKETMRLFPVGPFLMREVTNDVKIDKHTLPEGSTVAVVAAMTHRSPKYWNEPDKFIPERFSLVNSKNRHPWSYIPFSGGARSCVGIKFGETCLKVMIAQFIRKCRLTTNMKLESLKIKAHMSIRSQDGYKISIEKFGK